MKVTTATSSRPSVTTGKQTGGRERVAAPHGTLHAEPPQVAAGAEHGAAADGQQGEQRPPTGHVERIDELAHGDAAGEQAERRADPGEERPLVGQREAVVRLRALLEVDLPPPGHDGDRTQHTVTVPAMDSRLAGVVVFVASGSVLVLEILAGRLLAPYVGVSLETFTGIIGVVLAGIATGTWVGGWLADRIDPRRLLPGALVLGGAAAIAAVPIIRALGPSVRPPSPPSIVVLATLGFFAPSALLSAVTPLVVKVQLGALDHTGRVVGRLSALGTAGSLVACSPPASSSSPSSRRRRS